MKETPPDSGKVTARARQAGQGPATFSSGEERAMHVSPKAMARVSGMFDLALGETGPSPAGLALQGTRPPPGAIGTSPPAPSRRSQTVFARGSLVVQRPRQDELVP